MQSFNVMYKVSTSLIIYYKFCNCSGEFSDCHEFRDCLHEGRTQTCLQFAFVKSNKVLKHSIKSQYQQISFFFVTIDIDFFKHSDSLIVVNNKRNMNMAK